MKIAIFGGSFDPLHNGHYQIIQKLCNDNSYDEIWLVPNYAKDEAHKKIVTSNESRIKMLNLIKNEINNSKLKIDNFLLESQQVDILPYLKKQSKNYEIDYIIGSDTYNNLRNWHTTEPIENINKYVNLIVITRPNYEIKINELFPIKKIIQLNMKIESSEIKENYKKFKNLIPPIIQQYIDKNHLY